MHCKGYIITKKLPAKSDLSKTLDKYRENGKNKKFEWDWYEIGGRYSGKIKINFNPSENEDNWYSSKNRNNKYFISQAIEEIKEQVEYYEELDWLPYMGIRENILYVDGAYFKDTINFDITDCYLVIDDKKKLYVREYWNGSKWIKENEFDNKVKNINLQDKFILTIDFHD